ncbi:MAG: DsbA family protein [Candidatus Gastranaerophilales bacterium]|nr:DsbA family protein [Candidatus Gastranaerophilales bacterium]
MNKTRRILLTLLAIVGLGLSIELCVVYYNANFVVDAQPSICAISDGMDCDGVAKTSYSQFFGVPLSLWGVILYLFFLVMTYVDKLQNVKGFGILKVFKNPLSYMFCIGLFSFLVSMSLGAISVLKINSICIFCFMTYIVNLLIAITSKTKEFTVVQAIKNCFIDFIEAIKVKRNAFWFFLLCLLMSSILSYTTVSNILTPQIEKQNQMKAYMKGYDEITEGNAIGPKDADVIIHEYVDFNCGGCFMAHVFLHRIVQDFSNVRVYQHSVPLEKTCNHNMQHDGHKNSCLKTSYALAAAKQNMYWQMSDILFGSSPETEKEIIEEARLLDFDIKKLKEDANSDIVKEEIKQSIAEADSKEVYGTPTIFVGLKRILGAGTYPELRQTVIEQGGKVKE